MPKTFKATPDSEAGLVLSKNNSRLHGNKDNYVACDEKGTTINGPISFVSGSAQIRYGGLWTMNSELALSIPSTLATPTPVMMIDPPVGQLAKLMEDSVVMIALLGSFGGF